jgi:MFS family permease
MKDWYGLISGIGFAVSFSVCGILLSFSSDKNDRIKLLGVGCIVWSLTSLVSGYVDSLAVFGAMRVLFGAAASVCEPQAFGVLMDFFPP